MPRQVQALEAVPIASAAAGECFSIALDRNGDLWSWGSGLGLGLAQHAHVGTVNAYTKETTCHATRWPRPRRWPC